PGGHHLREVEPGGYLKHGERNARRVERLLRQAQHGDRVLASGEHQDRLLELRRRLPEDVDRLGLELIKMRQSVVNCGHGVLSHVLRLPAWWQRSSGLWF